MNSKELKKLIIKHGAYKMYSGSFGRGKLEKNQKKVEEAAEGILKAIFQAIDDNYSSKT